MKSEEDKNAQIGLEERSPIVQAWRNLKDSIFNVLFVILDKNDDEEEESFYGIMFETGADYLQMLAFPFDASVIAVWNGGQTLENVSSLISRLNISTYLPGVSFQTFLVLLYALILLIILVLLDIIYVSYSFSKKKFRFTWPLVILAQLVPLFVTIFFLPITETLISVVRCQTNEQTGFQNMISFPDIVCWQGWHLFHAAVTLLFSSLFVFISSVVALALFEPRMTTNKISARQNSTGEVVFIMNKIICQLVFSFTPFQDDWIYALMLFVLSGWLYWTYNMNDPFYNKKVSKFFRLMSSYYFWTNFMLLASQFLKLTGFNGGLVIWLSGLPFIGVIIIFQKKSNINKLFSSNLKFKSGEELDNHLTYVLQLLQNKDKDKNSYMLLIGYIEKHKQICLEDDCPLKNMKRRNGALNMIDMNEGCEMLIKQVQRMYRVGIKKYPMCTKLCLSFAFFRLEQIKNKNKAYEDFTYSLKTDPAFEQQFIVYRFRKIIKENLEENQENSSDLIELIRFQNHISLCEEAMVLAARLHKDFWLQLKEQGPELTKLNELGFKITQTVKKVKENYKEIIKINNSIPEMLYSYSIFSLLVLKETSEGKKLLEESKNIINDRLMLGQIKEKQTQFNILSGKEHPMICVSTKNGQEGKITSINLPFSEISGYMREGIVDRHLQKILPQIFEVYHSQLMYHWLQEQDTKSAYIEGINKGFIRSKSGYILPVEYKVLFNSDEEVFCVYFKLLSEKSTNYHMILDGEGRIREISAIGSLFLGVPKNINREQVKLQSLLAHQKLQQLVGRDNAEVSILIQGKENSYRIVVEEIIIKLPSLIEYDDEQHILLEEYNIVMESKLLGYSVQITKKVQIQNKLLLMQEEEVDMLDEEDQMQEIEDILQNVDEVRDLYRQPQLLQMVVSLAEKKETIEEVSLYKLKTKIKTMRLLNNEIKMVYETDNELDYNQGQGMNEDDDDIKVINLDDENYQNKIRKAINTKLDHKEITQLKYCFMFFLTILLIICILEMLFSVERFHDFKDKGQDIYEQSRESNQLSLSISNTFDTQNSTQTNYPSFAQRVRNNEVEFENSRLIEIKLKTGEVVEKNMTDSFIYMYSLLTDYFEGNSSNIDLIYTNYVKYIYPQINEIEAIEVEGIIILLIMFIISVICGLVMLLGWIYIRLQIDRKKFNILLWFLDIPIPYITYLGEHCDKYLKNYMENKELVEKGINFDNNQMYLEEYAEEENNNQEQMEEQEKIRKILIIKQRKQSLLSKLNCSYLKLCWIFIFTLIYPILTFRYLDRAYSSYSFLGEQWKFSSHQINWLNYLHFSAYMLKDNNTYVEDISMQEFMQENRKHFHNKMTQKVQSLQFNVKLLQEEYIELYPQMVDLFNGIYFHNVCQKLKNINIGECESIANSAFIGGYSIYSEYLYTVRVQDYAELRRANEEYAGPALLLLIEGWKQEIDSIADNSISVVSIIFYVYVVAVLGLLIGWLMYLLKLNTELNEGIKMLNMIPFKLLSRSRKETRQFLIWIIKQANKKNHNDDEQ